MFCRICGKQIPDDMAFCPHCGAATAHTDASPSETPSTLADATTEKVKPVRKKSVTAFVFAAISVLLAAALVLSFLGILPSPFGTSAAMSIASSQSFDTPEDAIKSFVAYMKAGDYNGILSTCAINNMAKGLDYKAYSEWREEIPSMYKGYLPSDYPDYVVYNENMLTKKMLDDIYNFVMSLNLPDEYNMITYGNVYPVAEGSFPDSIIKDMEPKSLDGLNMIDIQKNEIKNGEEYLNKRHEEAGVFGGEDIQRRTVLFEYKGDYYICGFTLIEYNGRWQVQDLSDKYSDIGFDKPTHLADKSKFYDIFEDINS